MDAHCLSLDGCEDLLMIFANYHIPTFIYSDDDSLIKGLYTHSNYSYINDVVSSSWMNSQTFKKEHKQTLFITTDQAMQQIIVSYKGSEVSGAFESMNTYVAGKELYDRHSRFVSKSLFWIGLASLLLSVTLPESNIALMPICFLFGIVMFFVGAMVLSVRGTKGALGFLGGIIEGFLS